MEKTDIKSMNMDELTEYIISLWRKEIQGKADIRVDTSVSMWNHLKR